jgi:xylulokinase
VVLIGGAARSAAVRALAPGVFGMPVTVPEPAEYVALGAARQAAWALAASSSAGGSPGALPDWPARAAETYEGAPVPGVRERYAALRDDAAAWQLA